MRQYWVLNASVIINIVPTIQINENNTLTRFEHEYLIPLSDT